MILAAPSRKRSNVARDLWTPVLHPRDGHREGDRRGEGRSTFNIAATGLRPRRTARPSPNSPPRAPSALIGQTVTYTASVTGAPAGERLGSVHRRDHQYVARDRPAGKRSFSGTVVYREHGDRGPLDRRHAISRRTGRSIRAPTGVTQAVVAATTTTVTSPGSTPSLRPIRDFHGNRDEHAPAEGGVPTGTVQVLSSARRPSGPAPSSAAAEVQPLPRSPPRTWRWEPIRSGAVYTPDGSFQAGEGAGQVAINPAATLTLLSSSASSAIPGQSVTFTAIVAAVPPGGGTPTGSVTFKNGSTLLGTVPLVVVGNQLLASLTTVFSTAGNLDITASYASSNGNHEASSATLPQTVLGTGVSVSGTTLYLVGANTSDDVTISIPSPQGSQGAHRRRQAERCPYQDDVHADFHRDRLLRIRGE